MASFEIRGLTFCYPERTDKALDNVCLTVEEGEFVVLCGKSGCGKTTLLRHLKPILTPHGRRSGDILFEGRPIGELSQRDQAAKIGYVLQQPDSQIVTDKVWHELAFGLESLGMSKETIRLRVAEMASFFGIQDWFMRDVSTLSGGQKQLLNLASIMAMQPSALILDEPTSQLDPIAAAEFLDTVKKINSELGVTIVLTEHRLEEVMPMADRAVILEKGRVLTHGTPAEVGRVLRETNSELFVFMPSAMQVYAGIHDVPADLPCPITVKEGRRFLSALSLDETQLLPAQEPAPAWATAPDAIVMKDVWFRYDRQGEDILRDVSLQVKQGTLHAIVGGNGTGKTTTLSLISRLYRPYRGKILIEGKPLDKYSDAELFRGNLGVLPQNPQALFVKKTVRLDLLEMFAGTGRKEGEAHLTREQREEKVCAVAKLVGIEHLLESHPYDLSGGEQQRAALAKVLLLEPRILLLDEPTKGLDGGFKVRLAELFRQLLDGGATILMVSHDVEFCARYADVCTMFFNGSAVSSAPARAFFSGNSFYTTAANRLSRHRMTGAVTNEEVIARCNRAIRKGES